jgi:hypothetical protein
MGFKDRAIKAAAAVQIAGEKAISEGKEQAGAMPDRKATFGKWARTTAADLKEDYGTAVEERRPIQKTDQEGEK